jgi:CDP-6-deoxy-D-xylo-4-hexulose-3-dehydrase
MKEDLRVYVGYFELDENARKAVTGVLDSGRISEGKFTNDFENQFAVYNGSKYCVATSSGTAAIQAGLIALSYHPLMKQKKAVKIITTPLTYIATVNAIHFSRFEPVFVDIDKTHFGIKPEEVERTMEEAGAGAEDFAAILAVHLMGYPCDMDSLRKIADKYNLLLLEDSAQAHGSLYKGKKTGSIGLFGAFSFYIAHNIQAGEMGAIVTDDDQLYGLLKQVKANGRVCDCPVCTRPLGYCPHMPKDDDDEIDYDPRFTHSILGLNFKTMEFQAALALSQLKKADEIFAARQRNVRYYDEHLKKYSNRLQLPEIDKNVSYLAYPIVLRPDAGISRKKLRLELENYGVETRPLFGSIPTQQPAYSHLAKQYEGKLPNADYIGLNGFYIGCHQYLTEAHLEKVVKTFNKVLG